MVQQGTAIVRKGQSGFSSAHSGPADLTRGTLVSVEFGATRGREAIANQIEILATPGADFVFSGNVVSIDLHSGELVLMDPADQQDHQLSFDRARLPTLGGVHLGDQVRVVASYDGLRFVANQVAMINP
jgi:hypothetical protein